MKTTELNAVRIGLLDIAVDFDENFRLKVFFYEAIREIDINF
jgi:hypothetical protein